jgi:hypothetical protein
MTLAERLYRWNGWYVDLPTEWRFQIVLWPLVALGAINMALTIAIGFPFGLLVLLGILFYAAVRVPAVLGWIVPTVELRSGEAAERRLEIPGTDWLVDLNRRYDAMPELRRLWVFPVILLVAGTVNMLLTIWAGFPFGLLFLLALVFLVALRAPYAGGLLRSPPSLEPLAPGVEYKSAIASGSFTTISSEPHSLEREIPETPSMEPTNVHVLRDEMARPSAPADEASPANNGDRTPGSSSLTSSPHIPEESDELRGANDQVTPPHNKA